MSNTGRSDCPINLTAELLGDRWSLLVLRDIMFADRRSYRVMLQKSEEGIASNILASRLKHLVAGGLLTTTEDPAHKQRVHYSLTEPAIELLPTMIQIGAWGARFLPADDIRGPWFSYIYELGPAVWKQIADDLRHRHLGATQPGPDSATVASLAKDYKRKL
ncbi:winged helix-turn-helix transcriptional regulator, partial [Rhodococcus sp. NPDC057014]|uniref:winged helix-turn-helix transcriptional regulator n=1 Tax=Rhodococcus sp. NPDC057014 TaxID=3346000 RepID=UPI00363FC130